MQKFQSTLPTRGSDYDVLRFRVARQISIHAPHEGERRRAPFCPWRSCTYFNPRSPRGGATFNSLIVFVQLEISIHAPHEGERLLCIKNQIFISVFQSTLPTRGSDVLSNYCKCLCKNFNPRSPRGGATMMSCVSASLGRFQSTLPTRGSDDVPHFALGEAVPISIHAPHEGERPAPPVDINDLAANFNPRSPRGGATWARLQGTIHRRYFNPRSPRGGATHCCYSIAQFCRRFQSTLPTRGSDGMNLYLCTDYLHISIHAPHEGERP